MPSAQDREAALFQPALSAPWRKYGDVADEGFSVQARHKEGAYPQRSGTDEQRSLRLKGPSETSSKLRQGALSKLASEPHLLQSCQGLRQRQASLAPILNAPRRITEALERLVQLYDAWGRPAHAAEWKQKLAAFQQAAKAVEKKGAQQ